MPGHYMQRGSRQPRVSRRPQHRWQLQTLPWQIQPFVIAPVLPGETMQNALIQSRIVTDPIRNPLIGWWAEYYLFYVKHRDLTGREDFTAMMLDPDHDLSAYREGGGDSQLYVFPNGINWQVACLERVVEEYFRVDGEGWDDFTVDGLPAASVSDLSWLDSVHNASDHPDYEQTVEVKDGDPDHILASDMETALMQYQLLRSQGLTQMSYEDFIRTYGVAIPEPDDHRPELVRYVRDWTYPTNTVDPESGAPSSACSWAVAERVDKARFFREPGFLFGVFVARPKVYFSQQAGAAVGLLDNSLAWLPAVMAPEHYTSLKHVVQGGGPLPENTDAGGYFVDVRDLFMYGDQLVNFDLQDSGMGLVALPTDGMQKRYASEQDVISLFVDEGEGEPLAGAWHVRQDGVMSLNILGMQRDNTATV